MSTGPTPTRRTLRPSGYASRFYEIGYGVANPFHDLIVWWGLLPLGGARRCRRLFASWCELVPGLEIVGVDLSRAPASGAIRRKVPFCGVSLQSLTSSAKSSPRVFLTATIMMTIVD